MSNKRILGFMTRGRWWKSASGGRGFKTYVSNNGNTTRIISCRRLARSWTSGAEGQGVKIDVLSKESYEKIIGFRRLARSWESPSGGQGSSHYLQIQMSMIWPASIIFFFACYGTGQLSPNTYGYSRTARTHAKSHQSRMPWVSVSGRAELARMALQGNLVPERPKRQKRQKHAKDSL